MLSAKDIKSKDIESKDYQVRSKLILRVDYVTFWSPSVASLLQQRPSKVTSLQSITNARSIMAGIQATAGSFATLRFPSPQDLIQIEVFK